MLRKILLVVWLCPLAALGQFKISGKVLSLVDKAPVANASAFLSNATAGTKTNDDGNYTITNVKPGQYELVVSIIGYETYRQNIMVNADLHIPDIEILPRAIALREVKIRPDPDWMKHYGMFREEFLGFSEFAQHCKILNPKVIDFHYDKDTRELTAGSSDFIEVENKALGYKVKYLLASFTKNYSSGLLYYEGSALFEDLKGRPSQLHKWEKNRLKAYNGSSMHFLRAVLANDLPKEGFRVLRLQRTPNPDYKSSLDPRYIEKLYTAPLTVVDFVKLTDQKGLFALGLRDCLYIMHTDQPITDEKGGFVPDNSTSIITFKQDYSLFDTNGIFVDPSTLTFEGDWGKSRLAELLPVDYEPH